VQAAMAGLVNNLGSIGRLIMAHIIDQKENIWKRLLFRERSETKAGVIIRLDALVWELREE
jgi:hypothetical protein